MKGKYKYDIPSIATKFVLSEGSSKDESNTPLRDSALAIVKTNNGEIINAIANVLYNFELNLETIYAKGMPTIIVIMPAMIPE